MVSHLWGKDRIFPQTPPELAKIIFFSQDINNHGIRRSNAARRLRCSGYLPDRKPANYLDILKGVEKQLGGTKWNKYLIKSISGSTSYLFIRPQLLVIFKDGNTIKLREHPKSLHYQPRVEKHLGAENRTQRR